MHKNTVLVFYFSSLHRGHLKIYNNPHSQRAIPKYETEMDEVSEEMKKAMEFAGRGKKRSMFEPYREIILMMLKQGVTQEVVIQYLKSIDENIQNKKESSLQSQLSRFVNANRNTKLLPTQVVIKAPLKQVIDTGLEKLHGGGKKSVEKDVTNQEAGEDSTQSPAPETPIQKSVPADVSGNQNEVKQEQGSDQEIDPNILKARQHQSQMDAASKSMNK